MHLFCNIQVLAFCVRYFLFYFKMHDNSVIALCIYTPLLLFFPCAVECSSQLQVYECSLWINIYSSFYIFRLSSNVDIRFCTSPTTLFLLKRLEKSEAHWCHSNWSLKQDLSTKELLSEGVGHAVMVQIRVRTLKQWCLYTMKNVLGIGNVVFLGFGPNVLWGVFVTLNFGLLLPLYNLVILYELMFAIRGFQGCLFFCIHNMPLCLALLLLYPEFCCYLYVSFYSELIQPPCILSPTICVSLRYRWFPCYVTSCVILPLSCFQYLVFLLLSCS